MGAEYLNPEIQAIVDATISHTKQLEALNSHIQSFINTNREIIASQQATLKDNETTIGALTANYTLLTEQNKELQEAVTEINDFLTKREGGLNTILDTMSRSMTTNQEDLKYDYTSTTDVVKDLIKSEMSALFLKIVGLFAVLQGVVWGVQQIIIAFTKK